MVPKEKREKLEITRKQIDELTLKIRNTITDYNLELEAMPVMYKCEEWRKSPLYHPVIKITKNNRHIAVIEINFNVVM